MTAGVDQPHGRGRSSGSTLTLEIGGLPVGTQAGSTSSRAARASVTFDPVTVSRRNMRGTVTLGDDALAADNAFNFVRVAGRAGARDASSIAAARHRRCT